MRRRTFCLAVVGLALSAISWTQKVDYDNVPDELREAVGLGKFAETYDLDGSVNPFYLRGDFDGDGKPDYAFRIRSKTDQSAGFAIWLSSLRRFVILGAGKPVQILGLDRN